MAVKDKLELERLLSMMDDLERMYQEGDIGEETYREMKKNYQHRITRLQNRIMDLESDIKEVISTTIDSIPDNVTENVNDILKNTMRTLKEQLKTKGVTPTKNKFKREETIKIPTKASERLTVRCDVEYGGVFIKEGSDANTIIKVLNMIRSDNEEKANEKLDKIEINCTDYIRNQSHIIEIKPEGPRNANTQLFIELPPSSTQTLDISVEKGNILLKNLTFDNCKLEIENGNIDLKNCDCASAAIDIENGAITLDEINIQNNAKITNENGNIKIIETRGARLKALTEKGNITAYCSFEKSTLSTELGRIKFKPIDIIKQEYDITSELGSIKILVDDKMPLYIKTDICQGTIKNITRLSKKLVEDAAIFESENYKTSDTPITMRVSTCLGSIKIINK